MTEKAPSRYWYAEKNGTAVKRYDTQGDTPIDLPGGIESVGVGSLDELLAIEPDTSVLSDEERAELGIF